jgi:Tfp pilus assembly protein PilN
MRPINLIPPEDRRGDRAPMRTGNLSYVLVGGLALLLLAVVATAFAGKQISDRESEKAALQQELTQATARADSLSAFANFRAIQEARTATVASLAESRFDWERVIHELSLVMPADISLTNLTGTVSPEVTLENGAAVPTRDSVAGPALELVGCAPGEDSVAALIAALEDIDGVTRVGLEETQQNETQEQGASPTTDSASQNTDDCRFNDEIARFQIVAAFDAVPTPGTATTAPSVPAPVAPGGGGDQLADAQTEKNVQQASVREQTAKADKARANLTPGG